MALPLLRPGWPAPPGVGAAMSTRLGGVGDAPFDSLNLRPPAPRADGAVDAPQAVRENQRRYAAALGATPVWLDQVHGSAVVRLHAGALPVQPRADASITTDAGVACTVAVADCLPVLLCCRDGAAVGAAHAGWRGLAAGVVENTLAALCQATGCAPDDVVAWLGPCIGPTRFEVGADVRDAFAGDDACFMPRGGDKWLADLPHLARRRLARAGVAQVSGGGWCTVSDASRFFSFRRDGVTGRMAASVWRLG